MDTQELCPIPPSVPAGHIGIQSLKQTFPVRCQRGRHQLGGTIPQVKCADLMPCLRSRIHEIKSAAAVYMDIDKSMG